MENRKRQTAGHVVQGLVDMTEMEGTGDHTLNHFTGSHISCLGTRFCF